MKNIFNIDDFCFEYHMDEKPYFYEIKNYIGSQRILKIPKELIHTPITKISSCAFRNNKEIKILILNDNINYIDSDAFEGTEDLIIYTPYESYDLDLSHLKGIEVKYGFVAITQDTELEYALFTDETALVISHHLDQRKYGRFGRFGITVEIPESINGYIVSEIERYCFENVLNARNYILPHTLRKISKYSFKNNEMLESFYIPEGVTTIDDFCLSQCMSLKTIEIPHSVVNVGNCALQGNYRSLVLLAGLKENRNFHMNWNPENRPVINEYIDMIVNNDIVYALTTTHKAIVIGNTINSIIDIEIPSQIEIESEHYVVTAIGPWSFNKSKYIRHVKLPQTLTHIYESAFSESDIVSIDMGENIEFLGEAVFNQCIYLLTLKIMSTKIREIPRSFCSRCLSLVSVELNDNIETIFEEAFFDAEALKEFNFPVSLRKIKESAFYGTSITYVELGYAIEEIGDLCFGQCNELTTLVILNEYVKLGDHIVTEYNSTSIYIEGSSDSDACNKLRIEAKNHRSVFSDILSTTEVDGVKYAITDFENAIVIGYSPMDLDNDVRILSKVKGVDVTIISKLAFKDAINLNSLIVPMTVTRINNGFIKNCTELRKLYLPRRFMGKFKLKDNLKYKAEIIFYETTFDGEMKIVENMITE
jgi:hypothetical protein